MEGEIKSTRDGGSLNENLEGTRDEEQSWVRASWENEEVGF